jgi:FAD/FMN-containing dehydrogenase
VNTRYSGIRPLAILRARNVSDVRAAVRWCAKHDVKIAARSGGHSYAGYSTVQGGLVVDLGRLDGISVAPGGKTVQVGAGNRLIDMYSALASRGLTVPAGSCPTVGVGGLALGGGVGLAGRALGTTSDNIQSLTVVTANGQAVTADSRRNPDLYWACRGGRRRQLRHRDRLHVHHPSRGHGVVLLRELRLGRRGRRGRPVATLGAERAAGAVRPLLAGDRVGRADPERLRPVHGLGRAPCAASSTG